MSINAVFEALAHPARRKILRLLQSREMSAGEIATHFELSKPTLSSHFNKLRRAELIAVERQGTSLIYRLNASVLDEAVASLTALGTRTMTHKLLVTRFHLLLLAVMLALTITAFVKLKDTAGLPVHWGFDGKPDQFWPRDQALLAFPIVAVALTALFAAIGRFAPPEQVEPGRRILETALIGLLGLCCALQFSLILIGTGSDVDLTRIVAFLVAIFFIVLGAMLPNSRPNVYVGVRLPWTMKDPGNWTATHRLTGILMIVGGVGLGVVAWLWPGPATLFAAMAVAVFVPPLVGGIFSFVMSRR